MLGLFTWQRSKSKSLGGGLIKFLKVEVTASPSLGVAVAVLIFFYRLFFVSGGGVSRKICLLFLSSVHL